MDLVTGTLALIGGSDFGGDGRHHRPLFPAGIELTLVPTAMAYENPSAVVREATEHFASLGVGVRPLHAYTRADASSAELVDLARSSDALYITAGSPMHLRSVLLHTPLLAVMVEAWSRGATVAVDAESCSVLCSHMVDSRGGAFTVGLGLITTMTVIPRFDRWSPDKRHRTISLAPADLVVVGIDEATGLVRTPTGEWDTIGSGSVHVFSAGAASDLDALPSDLSDPRSV